MTLHVGITGTRHGCTASQLAWLRMQLDIISKFNFNPGEVVLHHGDCVGVDEETCSIARLRGWLTHAHPPDNPQWRAFTDPNNFTELPLPRIMRNHALVDAVSVLLAVPEGAAKRYPRSGTWATVRYTMEQPGVELRVAPWWP